MMKRFLLTATVLGSALFGMAQEHNHDVCGSQIVLEKQLQDPETRARYMDFQDALKRYTADPRVAVNRNENGIRIIPVVFHILHDGGSENISLTKVQQQLDVLNEDYRRLNPDTVNTPQRFYGDTEYTHFVFTSDAVADFVDDSAYISLHNRYGESFAFHFNNGSGDFSDSLAQNFDNVVEVNVSSNADTADLANALANAIDAQNGLNATFFHEAEYEDAPSFTVNGAEVASLSYTSEHTFTTSWNGTDTDTTFSDTLVVVLYENGNDPFEPTDTLYVFDADVTYDVFDGSGNVISTNGFTAEGMLTLSYTVVQVTFGDIGVDVSTDGLGYTDDVLLAGLWHITSTIEQQGTYLPADSKIEFRLATKDPLGNCTDGVVRVFTSKTNDANDGTGFKRESYWNAYSYLNIWVVNNIAMTAQGGGTVLGYAQFPGTGLLSTDGITVIASNIDIATSGGRTATHEVGHWLSLRHIWGDSNCGSDDVADTPTAANPNFGICGNEGMTYHTEPYNLGVCDPTNPDGEMFNNYMDYSSDACMNMFTLGQKARMDYTLEGDESGPGIRSYLISQQNLENTGVADPYIQSECAPVSLFYFQQSGNFSTQKMICEGEDVRFFESSYNGAVETFSWTFEGGEPASSSLADPVVDYNTPGVYDVSLTVSNSTGLDTRVEENMVVVSSSEAMYENDWGYVDNFWTEQSFIDQYFVFNEDGSQNKWEWYFGENGGTSGRESVRMFNYGNSEGEVDELVSPSYNLSTLSNPTLQFRYSGAARDNTPNDELRILLSSNCGETWTERERFEGFELINAGLVSNSYRPNASSPWNTVSINLGSTFSSRSNVRVKFRWVSGGRSNNFYIDDVTISGSPIGMEDLEHQIGLNVAPNPTTDMTTVTMTLPEASKISMQVMDVLGRDARNVFSSEMTNGTHRFDVNLEGYAVGVYYLRIMVDNDMIVKKIVKN